MGSCRRSMIWRLLQRLRMPQWPAQRTSARCARSCSESCRGLSKLAAGSEEYRNVDHLLSWRPVHHITSTQDRAAVRWQCHRHDSARTHV